MTQSNIRRALELHLGAATPDLPTAMQNDDFDPADPDTPPPYQECFVIPARGKARGLRQKTALHLGIFQVNLCYPAGSGTGDVDARADLLIEHFRPADTVLEFGGTKVRFRGFGVKAGPIPGRPGLYVVPVSFTYESIF